MFHPELLFFAPGNSRSTWCACIGYACLNPARGSKKTESQNTAWKNPKKVLKSYHLGMGLFCQGSKMSIYNNPIWVPKPQNPGFWTFLDPLFEHFWPVLAEIQKHLRNRLSNIPRNIDAWGHLAKGVQKEAPFWTYRLRPPFWGSPQCRGINPKNDPFLSKTIRFWKKRDFLSEAHHGPNSV